MLPPCHDNETYHINQIVPCTFNLLPCPLSPDDDYPASVVALRLRQSYSVAHAVVRVDSLGHIYLL